MKMSKLAYATVSVQRKVSRLMRLFRETMPRDFPDVYAFDKSRKDSSYLRTRACDHIDPTNWPDKA